MGIRRFWAKVKARTSLKQRKCAERIRAVRKVLRELRIRERWLRDQQQAVADAEQLEEIANKLSVLREQRVKGVCALREFRAECAENAGRQASSDRSNVSRTEQKSSANVGER